MATNLPPLDPTFAPPGMVAVEDDGTVISCRKCLLYPFRCNLGECIPHRRPDKRYVRFEDDSMPATASWPYDDMGTPVETGEQQ